MVYYPLLACRFVPVKFSADQWKKWVLTLSYHRFLTSSTPPPPRTLRLANLVDVAWTLAVDLVDTAATQAAVHTRASHPDNEHALALVDSNATLPSTPIERLSRTTHTPWLSWTPLRPKLLSIPMERLTWTLHTTWLSVDKGKFYFFILVWVTRRFLVTTCFFRGDVRHWRFRSGQTLDATSDFSHRGPYTQRCDPHQLILRGQPWCAACFCHESCLHWRLLFYMVSIIFKVWTLFIEFPCFNCCQLFQDFNGRSSKTDHADAVLARICVLRFQDSGSTPCGCRN